MTIEAVNQFLTKVNQDQKLQAEVSQAMEANGSQATTEVAAKHGYEFSQQELDSRIGQLKAVQDKQSAGSELNEEELETVAGGFCTPVVPAIGAVVTAVTGSVASEGVKRIGDDDEFLR